MQRDIPPGEKVSDDEIQSILAMAHAGHEPAYIADICGIPLPAVNRILNKERTSHA